MKVKGYDYHQDKTFLGEELTTDNIFKSNIELFDEITDDQIPKLQQSNILITFGCSWTWGIGSSYTENIKNADDLETSILINEEYNNWNDVYSYRGLITNKYNFTNLNFSKPGSSNQKQFRLAREFFTNTKNIDLLKQAKNVIVMWGITSTARTEFWYNETNEYESVVFNNNEEGHIPTGFGLTAKGTAVPKRKTNLVSHNDTHDVVRVLILDLYNHEIEVKKLAEDMLIWNDFFKNNNFKNLWFDTFNTHKYPLTIENLIEGDLMTFLANQITKTYHRSIWKKDDTRIDKLIKEKLVNPFSFHPTQKGHKKIVHRLSPYIENILER